MAVYRERQMINTEQESVYIDGCSLKQMAEKFAELISAYGEDATVDYQSYQYEEGKYLAVFNMVPETDAKMAYRIAQEEQWELARQLRDRAEYERLQQIYGEKK